MKKLIALLIVLSLLCLSGCELLGGVDDSTEPTTQDQAKDPSVDNKDDQNGEPDEENPTGNNNNNNGNNNTATGSGCSDDKHVDVNNDGKCDTCFVSVIVVVDIFAINDLHGKITSTSSQSGIGGLTTYLKNETDDNSILLASGDMWQGSAESNLTYGAFITDWMSELGFVSMTLGNHEYDWSETYISSNASLATFPFLAINVYDKTTGERAEYATPSIVIERDGVEIGIIGAIGDCYSSISGDVSGNFQFKVGDELTALVKAESDRLRAEGVDFIVYSLHDGYGSGSSGIKSVSNNAISSYYDAVLSNGYVDLVFEGHTHQSYILIDDYSVYHMQGGGENKGLSHAEIKINSANGNTGINLVEIVKYSEWSSLTPDPLVDELFEKYAEQIAAGDEELGYNRKKRDDTEIEQIVANLYYEFGLELWGDEYDITLGGGFLKTRNPYDLRAGTILYSDVYALLPFDNDIVLCSISGRDLLNKFINTSNSDYYICLADGVDTSSISASATYYVVVDSYTSTYAYNNLTEIARCPSKIYARDLLAQYIKDGNLA